jgi:hypothetical protein
MIKNIMIFFSDSKMKKYRNDHKDKVTFNRKSRGSPYETNKNEKICIKKGDFFSKKIKFPKLKSSLDIAIKSGVLWEAYLSIVKYPEMFYSSFSIPKKRGGYRVINSPSEHLTAIQHYIKENILELIPIHNCAYGYVKEKSIIDNAKSHSKNTYVMKVDLKNFFPSIGRRRLYYIFGKMCKYPKEVANNLVDICMFANGLPQGACTSPILSNIVAYKLDLRLYHFSRKLGIKYTRYVDDLTFSGPRKKINGYLLKMVSKIVGSEGFELNPNKTRFGNTISGVIITGLLVRNNKIKVPGKYIDNIKRDLYYIKKFGLESHLKKRKITGINYMQHLKGKINFLSNIEPMKGKKIMSKYKELMDADNTNKYNEIETLFDIDL